MTEFKIPAGVETTAELVECGNCHSPTLRAELIEGLCLDCRPLSAVIAPEQFEEQPTPLRLAVDTTTGELLRPDELAARRAAREQGLG